MRGLAGKHASTGAAAARRDERGFAVPTVMFMLLAAFAVVSIGVVASIQAQSGTVRDQQHQVGADHGGGRRQPGAASLQRRLHAAGLAALPASERQLRGRRRRAGPGAGGAPRSRAPSGAGTYTYQVKPTAGTIEIVSSGNFNGVTRRVDVTAKSASGQQVFIDAGVKTQNGIILDANSEIHSGTATGGDITLASNSKQCGLASVGVGHHLTTAGNAAYYQNVDCTTPAQPLLRRPAGHHAAPGQPGRRGDQQRQRPDHHRGQRQRPTPKDLLSGKTSDVTWSATHTPADDRPQQLPDAHRADLQLLQADPELELGALHRRGTDREHLLRLAGGTADLPLDDPAQPANGTTQMKLSSNTPDHLRDGGPSDRRDLLRRLADAGSPTC